MAMSKKVTVYQQIGVVFCRTINDQDVEYVNVLVRKKHKTTNSIMKLEMKLEEFKNLGYERQPEPQVICVRNDDNELIRVSIENGTRLKIYEKISHYYKKLTPQFPPVPYVNLGVYQSGVPTVKFVTMQLKIFEKYCSFFEFEDVSDE